MTAILKVEEGISMMSITAAVTPPTGHSDKFYTRDQWLENIGAFTATMEEPAPIDHRKVYDRFNNRPRGSTARLERERSEDESRPKGEFIDVKRIYDRFNGRG